MLFPNAYQISLENLDFLSVKTVDNRTKFIYFIPLYVVKEGEEKMKLTKMEKKKGTTIFKITCRSPSWKLKDL